MAPGDLDIRRTWQLIARVFLAHRGHLACEAGLGLSPVQCHVLALIEPGRPMSMSRLARRLSCDASNVTGLVDRLESRGLLARRPSPADRRVKQLDLTPAGARLRMQLLRRMSQAPLPVERLTGREQRALVRILEKLLDET